jgi:hypothetical protein
MSIARSPARACSENLMQKTARRCRRIGKERFIAWTYFNYYKKIVKRLVRAAMAVEGAVP